MLTFHSNTLIATFFKTLQFSLAMIIASFALISSGYAGQPLKVTVDQARIMRLNSSARTIIVGNPMIADVNIQDGQILVVMGKSTGSTNMIALDSDGREIANVDLIVQSNAANSLTLYRGSARVSMNCAPKCEKSLIVGDSKPEFELLEKQLTKKMSVAKSAAEFAN